MGSKLHSGNAAKESTDSNRTGMALGWVGVRTDVQRRQQAQLAVYRKNCQQAKIWKSDKFGKVWEKKKTTAAGPDKMEAAAAAEKKRKTAEAAGAEKNKATAATSDIFCLIAEAGEADTVARAATRTEAATDIQSVIRAGQRHQPYDRIQGRAAAARSDKENRHFLLELAGRLEVIALRRHVNIIHTTPNGPHKVASLRQYSRARKAHRRRGLYNLATNLCDHEEAKETRSKYLRVLAESHTL